MGGTDKRTLEFILFLAKNALTKSTVWEINSPNTNSISPIDLVFFVEYTTLKVDYFLLYLGGKGGPE